MDRELLRYDQVRVTTTEANFNGRVFALADFHSAHLELETEHAQRLGNILVVTLAVAASVFFFIPIQIGIWESKFYFAVGMFALLAVVALDDVRRSNSLRVNRLMLVRDGVPQFVYATLDDRFARQLEHVLSAAIRQARTAVP